MDQEIFHFESPRASLESLTKMTLDYNPKRVSMNELAKTIIWTGLEPVIELEREGVFKGLKIYLHGGTLKKLNPTKDYDLLAIYEEVKSTGSKPATSAADSLKQNIFGRGKLNEEVAYAVDIRTKNLIKEKLHPNFLDIWVYSEESYARMMNVPESEMRANAFSELSLLPSAIIHDNEQFGPYYGDGMVDEDIDRNRTIVFCLLLAKIYRHNFRQAELEYMGESMFGRPAEFGRYVRQRGFSLDQFIARNLDLLEEHVSKNIKRNLGKFMKGKIHGVEAKILAHEMVDEFSQKLDIDTKGHLKYVYEGIVAGKIAGANAIENGLLIYQNGVKLF